MDLPEELDIGVPTGQRNPHLAYRDADQCAIFNTLSRRWSTWPWLTPFPPVPLAAASATARKQSKRIQPQLIAPQVVCAGAVTKQHQLFFNPILHVSSSAIMFFIQGLRWPCFSTQRGHHEPRILSFLQMLGLGHHSSRTAPALPRLINELWNSRVACPVCWYCACASPSPSRSPPSDDRFSPVPASTLTRFASHQAISSSRQNPESPAPPGAPGATQHESVPPMRCSSSTLPAAASMFDGRNAHTTGTLRRRCTTVGSSSARSSHGRNAPPGARVTDRR